MSNFHARKSKILSLLSVPPEEYDDLSPKGSIDTNIRELIDEVNGREGWVTTSSCGGRVAVFLEGRKAGSRGDEGEENQDGDSGRKTIAGIGGKGGGGRWLYVSHDPVSLVKGESWAEKFGMLRSSDDIRGDKKAEDVRFVRFKFEPMILHILTSSPTHAQTLLTAALQSGFRESGALNLTSGCPMVGVRSMGLGMESVVGVERDGVCYCVVPEWQLRDLVGVANARFRENEGRIARFRGLLMEGKGKEGWEDGESRARRLRGEGLRRREEMRRERDMGDREVQDDEGYEIDLFNGF
ncbi:hypothetical protein GLAREA_01913 [Glarea lozoyensis ATCC 20868]|uniref:tRNA(Phe) 7-[(3-amino-3-carboxypropyl)-4-demethylwyosine(37)-N(4)]-methyltransferase n=1 Tax=Glarea lozoyensis (strain ATCC 20868 / MF5171) TaxID=1116229 RepID=S3D1S6_GLAL2|nr:uncharacterized protein GLAREA_01913 [Glarea lozoyensis ATCC 20868]EPE26001.1 hypothetical protein GLAREA_01913 [Glarea lozoyensis ATCC 20868]